MVFALANTILAGTSKPHTTEIAEHLQPLFDDLKKELKDAWTENIRLAKALREAHKSECDSACKACQLAKKLVSN